MFLFIALHVSLYRFTCMYKQTGALCRFCWGCVALRMQRYKFSAKIKNTQTFESLITVLNSNICVFVAFMF